MVERVRQEPRDRCEARDPVRLRLHLLGTFRLTRNGAAVDTLKARRRQQLFAYLALLAGLPVERSYLAAVLWPESSERQARANLRHLLHTLRRAVPEYDLLIADTSATLTWRADGSCAVDTVEFLAALDRADLAERRSDADTALHELRMALDLYPEVLLPGHDDEWVLIERERFERARQSALERSAQLLEERREYDDAVRYYWQLVRADPLRESAYRSLMRLFALSGNRPALVQTYQSCAQTLNNELGIAPSAATEDLYQALLGSEPRDSSSPDDDESRPPLVGRHAEWSQLQSVWREVITGRPHAMLLSGEAGIGKTRLAEEFLDWLQCQGVTVVSARCYSAEGSLSFAPVVSWLHADALQEKLAGLDDHWLVEISRLLPDVHTLQPDLPQPAPLTEGWQRRQFFEALARAIHVVRGPLVLFIDDLQWCDPDTFEWLRFLLRFQPDARLLLIGTMRPEETVAGHPLTPFVASLQRDGQVTGIGLQPLSEAETGRLISSLLESDSSQHDVRGIYRETEGNPLFIVEMLRAGIHVAEESRELPTTVQAVIEDRLRLLSRPALDFAQLAAVIGREFVLPLVAAASRLDEDELAEALDELVQRRIVRERRSAAYDFTHDKLREVAYQQLGEMRRRLLHRRVALAMEQQLGADLDASARQLGYHYERAGLHRPAARHYLHAASQARRIYANQEAIRLYRRGLSLVQEDNQVTDLDRALLEGLGDVLLVTGSHQQAREFLSRAIRSNPDLDGVELARLHQKLGNSWRASGRFEDALAAYAAAEAALGSQADYVELWIDLQMDRMRTHYWQGDWKSMQVIVDEMEPYIKRHATPRQRVEFVRLQSNSEFRRARYVISREALERLHATVAIAEETGDLALLADIKLAIGFCLLWRGDPTAAREQLSAALAIAEQTGHTELRLHILGYLTISSRLIRDIEAAERYARQALAVASETDMLPHIVTANVNLAWVAWMRGDLETCERLAREALETWQYYEIYPFQWLAIWPLIDISVARGDVASAVSDARLLLDETQQRLPEDLETLIESALETSHPARPLSDAVQLARERGYL